MSSIRRRTVTTADGVHLHVVEAGDPAAPPLVLIHGFACSSRYWHRQLADPVLTERFRVIAPDLRGHGSSQSNLAGEHLSAASMDEGARLWAQDVDAVCEDLEAPVVVGWSFGGAVVQSQAYVRGGIGNAAAVVLLNVPCILGPPVEGSPVAALVSPEAIGALVATTRGEHEGFAGAVLSRGPHDEAVDPNDLEMALEVARQCPGSVCSAMLAYAFDFRAFIASLPEDERQRMIAVVSEDDQIFRAEAMHDVWRRAGVRTVGVPGEGHALFLRDPDRFRAVLLDCL
jgi:pimeloyl-ACP methyl ester carboxylesterase